MHQVDLHSKLAKPARYAGVTTVTFFNVSPDILSLSRGVDELRRISGGGAMDCIELRFEPIGGWYVSTFQI